MNEGLLDYLDPGQPRRCSSEVEEQTAKQRQRKDHRHTYSDSRLRRATSAGEDVGEADGGVGHQGQYAAADDEDPKVRVQGRHPVGDANHDEGQNDENRNIYDGLG